MTSPPDAGAPRVLIVEDSPDVVLALQLVMEAAGNAVRTAMTVEEAVREGRAGTFDVMLLDITLPDGSGLEVLERLAAAGASPRHTIALTGHDDHIVRDRCLRAGCAEVMVKPVPMRVLMARVKEVSGVQS